ncbi:phospholipase D-like domain-containing protein [Deinococcus sp.]|uniref:phospholipase D-like domain-containing protein n=1 Tax=Deinococcus sp. TaxID=47478 RepID=UPI0025B8864C|nr:phospholipase D-like domain-containing protein [Deinococcus sp.]
MPPLRLLLSCLALSLGGGATTAQALSLPVHLGLPLPAHPSAAPECGEPADVLDLAVWRVYAADGRPDLSCGNAFVDYQRTPRTALNPVNAFDQIAGQIRAAHTEVLLTNMEWHAGPGRAGWTFAQAVSDLYRKVRADPAAYPQGMSVHLALGGFPDLSRGDGGTFILEAVRDLRALGVPISDPAVGWTFTATNYRYFPHSHVKMVVIDGLDVTAAGFNYTDWHLTRAEPGGHDLHDVGLRMRGPVAQDGVAVFDDLWRHSNQVRCPVNVPADQVFRLCTLGLPDPVTHPAAAQQAQPAGTSRAYLLYRRPGYDMADQAMQSLIASARTEIDLMQADFSPDLNCWMAYVSVENCERPTFPPYLAALLDAVERGVKVRVLTVNYGYGKIANRSGIALMRYEARRRGLSDDAFDARYVKFDMHTKAMTVDRRTVEVGSMNFHFSSWGGAGLNEAVIATNDPEAVRQEQADFGRVWAQESIPVPPEPWLKYVRKVAPEDLWPPAPAPRQLPDHPWR